jgi:hypothetical protein
MSPRAVKINLKDKRNIKVGIMALRTVSKWTDKAALTLEKFEGQQGSQYSHGPQHSHDQPMHLEVVKAQIEEHMVKKQDKKYKIRHWLPVRGKSVNKVTTIIEEVEVTEKSEVQVKTKNIEQPEVNRKIHVSENMDVQVNTEPKKITLVLKVTRPKKDVGVNAKQKAVVVEKSATILEVYDTDGDEADEENDVVSENEEEESARADESDVEEKSDTENDSDTEDESEREGKSDAGEQSEEEGETQVQGKPEVSAKLKQDNKK